MEVLFQEILVAVSIAIIESPFSRKYHDLICFAVVNIPPRQVS